jgi:hypothetical protein
MLWGKISGECAPTELAAHITDERWQMLQLKLFFLHLCKEFYLEGLSEELSDWTEFEYLVKKV